MFAGNIAEAGTLPDMLKDLAARHGALVIMDAGIATEANIAWLQQTQGYRYLVVSRERTRQFDPDQAVKTLTAVARNDQLATRRWTKDGTEVRLYCQSAGARPRRPRSAPLRQAFETGLPNWPPA